MSIGFAGHTKAFALEADKPTMVASRNLHRKGIYLASTSASPVYVAVGLSPAPEDFFQLTPYEPLVLDHLAPVGPLWARGTGRLTVIDSEDPIIPFDPATLFANGRRGIWIDPHDHETLFQDESGTIPAVVGSQVKAIRCKASGKLWTIYGTLKGAILKQRNYQNYLDFDGDCAYRVDDGYNWTQSHPNIYIASGIQPRSHPRWPGNWFGVLGNNGGGGMGFFHIYDRRAMYSDNGGCRSHSSMGSVGSAQADHVPYSTPSVISGQIFVQNSGSQQVDGLSFVNGKRSGFSTRTATQSSTTYSTTALGLSSGAHTDPTLYPAYCGELHGVILAENVTEEERHKIDMYLGADVGAPINGV